MTNSDFHRSAESSDALGLLAAEDERQSKLHDLLETIREQIRLEIQPENRPDGLFKNIQDAVYAMRGRTRLLDDAAITHALNNAEPLAGLEQRFMQVLDGWEEDSSSPAAVSALQYALGCVRDAMHEVNAIQSRIADGRSDSPSPAIASPVAPSRDEERGRTFNDAQGPFESREDLAKAIAYELEDGAFHGARVTGPHLDNYHIYGHVNLLALAGAILRRAQPPAAPVDPVVATIKRAPELLDAAEGRLAARSSAGGTMEGQRDAIVQAIHAHVDIREFVGDAPELTGVEDAADAAIAAFYAQPPAAPVETDRLLQQAVIASGTVVQDVEWEPCSECPSLKFCRRHKVSECKPHNGSSAATEHAKVADWLDDQARIATNSLHCGDNSAMIHQTHDWAGKLEAAARHLRAVPQPVRAATIEECAKHLEHEADVATNSLHCGDNSATIAATHRVSRAYYEAAKSIRSLSLTRPKLCGGDNG